MGQRCFSSVYYMLKIHVCLVLALASTIAHMCIYMYVCPLPIIYHTCAKMDKISWLHHLSIQLVWHNQSYHMYYIH